MLDWSCPVEGRKAWEPPERFFQYFPIMPRSISWGLYLSGAGCEHVLPGQRYSPSGHPKLYHQEWETGGALPEFQAIYVTRGAGVFESAHGGRHEIAAGDLIFAFPGVWHRYRPTLEVGWDEYWISANGEMLHRLLREGFLSPSDPVLKVGLNEDLVRAYRNLLGYVQAATAPNPHVLAAHAMAIVGTVLAPPPDAPPNASPYAQRTTDLVTDRLVAQSLKMIWGYEFQSMTVDDVARQLPTTRRSLERRFRRALGRTVYEEITRRCAERAKLLLQHTSRPMEQVAAGAGFTDATRMGKVFRRLFGLTPSAYRRLSRNTG
jgi:AraC-like DNA-binding protein